MRLISCYIENFGGLHQYAVEFKPEITVIEEPNGFGKTTLAEFIRAMFYGFPRAGKFLEKNKRKKYHPWQGGKYGGNLIFEHKGKRYRINRSFGEKPNQDTFALSDADTGRRNTDFSENIGSELFGLDSDSFERSTYMPQLHIGSQLTTDSIQAKLGGLVDDTNDINNYEKAMESLRAKRSSFIPFRGNGGSVAREAAHISGLREELSGAGQIYSELQNTKEHYAECNRKCAEKEQRREKIRSEIRRASEAEARKAHKEKYAELSSQCGELAESKKNLERKYPAGMPGQEELAKIDPLYDKVVSLEGQSEKSPAEKADENFLKEKAERFTDGIPEEEEFDGQQENYKNYIELETKLKNTGLTGDEQIRLENLRAFFAAGAVSDDFIEDCQQKAGEIITLQSRMTAQKLPAEDEKQLRNLEGFFVPGVPSETELNEKQKALVRCAALRDENTRLAEKTVPAFTEEKPHKKAGNPMPLILLCTGIIGFAAGIVLMILHSYALGGVLLALGVLLFVGAIFVNMKHSLSKEIAAVKTGNAALNNEDREKIQNNRREAESLERDILDFVSRYITDNRSLPEKMQDIAGKKHAYESLAARAEWLKQEKQRLQSEIAGTEEELKKQLSPYFAEISYFDECIMQLRDNAIEFDRLLKKESAQKTESKEYINELTKLKAKISVFLEPFYGETAPENFGTELNELRNECREYKAASLRVQAYNEEAEKRRAELQECEDIARDFTEKYKISLDLHDRNTFKVICDDTERYAEITGQYPKKLEERDKFYGEHRESLESPEDETACDTDIQTLKDKEKELTDAIGRIGNNLAALRSRIKQLNDQAELIPQKQDELDSWKQKKSGDEKNSDLIDKTMEFLENAKESLSYSYLGPVKQSFARYMGLLAGEKQENITVQPDLNVRMERMGEARDLEYFSVGQSDMVVLCMRLALVDALFKDVKPFIILDDPFVNLDDEHTFQALRMLREIGKDHQVVYLVCNSSRMLNL